MSREFELVLECARHRWDPSAGPRIANLVQEDIDWHALLQRARLNRVMPLVYAGLSTHAKDALPQPVADELRSSFRASARNGIALSGHLLQVLHCFEQEGIQVLPFKGPALAMGLYGDLALRSFGDVDVLIDTQDVAKAREALIKRGYVVGWSHSEWEFHYDAPSGGHTIDVHHRIAPDHFPSPGSFQELWQRRHSVSLLNTTVSTIGHEDLVLALSVELVRDYLERKPRLVQICDVAALLTRVPALDWERILAHASAIGCHRILLLDLLLARNLLRIELPREVGAAAAGDRSLNRLAAYAARRLSSRVDVPSPGARLDTLFYLRTRERSKDKWRYLHYRVWSRVRPVITPTEKDSRFLALPQSLSFLAYGVRPIRVINDYIIQRWRKPAQPAANTD